MPARVESRREACRRAHDRIVAPPGPDTCEQRIARLPHARAGHVLVPVAPHLRVDAIRRAAKRELAQRQEVALAEEVLHGALGLFAHVDLAFAQPLQQVVRRQVDQHDLVGLIEDPVRQRFAHLDAGDAADDVVQALDVLDVDRCIDVDAGGEEFQHVLIALGMARPRRVGVRQLVDEQQRRFPRERGVEIELLERRSAVVDRASRQHVEAGEQSGSVLTAVRFDDADHDVAALLALPPCVGEHGVRLADAGRCPEEDLERAPLRARVLVLDPRQQRVGVGTRVGHPRILSNARLSAQHVDGGLPEESKPGSGCLGVDEVLYRIGGDTALAGDTGYLVVRGGEADVGIEP